MIRCDIDEKSVMAIGGASTLALELGCLISDFLGNPQLRRYTIAAIITGLNVANVTEEEKELIFEMLKGE